MKNNERIDFRLPADERAELVRAAEAEGMPLSLWLRRIAKKEARKVLGDSLKKRAGGR
jgi:uncharacterized protein (DUF1778 family)